MTTSSPQSSILVVDDDPLVAPTIAAALGQKVTRFASGKDFLAAADSLQPTAIFVDVNLGVGDLGIDLIPSMRARWQFTPIIVVTMDHDGELIGRSLASGANDYVKKPLDPKELTGRLRARAAELNEKASRDEIVVGDCRLNLGRNEISGPKGTGHLSQSDMQLLAFLASSNGTMVTRTELKAKLWGSVKVSDNALDKKLHAVRAAIKAASNALKLQSEYGKGFRLEVVATVQKSA